MLNDEAARTVRTTGLLEDRQRTLPWTVRSAKTAALCFLLAVALLTLAGCSNAGSDTSAGTGSTNASAPVGHSMAGPAQKVVISKQVLAATPKPWVLTTPQSAVRSYLDWTSYAYRVATSDAATPTMSAAEAVRVDSYTQFNLEKSRLIDQTLVSISFGKASVGGTSTVVPTKEKWTYRYVSISSVGKTIGGPYSATYNAKYTVVKTAKGWVVDSVDAKAVGGVK
jgi:hypothetical protein